MLKIYEVENYKEYGKCLAISNDNIEALVTLDVGSLVDQGIGEFTEKFEKSSLSVKNNVENIPCSKGEFSLPKTPFSRAEKG